MNENIGTERITNKFKTNRKNNFGQIFVVGRIIVCIIKYVCFTIHITREIKSMQMTFGIFEMTYKIEYLLSIHYT